MQYLVVVKNSFLEVVAEEDLQPRRRRALSDFTGMCEAKEKENRARARKISAVSTAVNSDHECLSTASSSGLESLTSSDHADERTTLMVRNMPNAYSLDMFLMLLDLLGFKGRYDFVYLPIDFCTNVNLGYAFVNCVSHRDSLRLTASLQDFHDWAIESQKVCHVSWSYPHQGLPEHLERYRNSPVMHETVPETFQPRWFVNGQSVPLPPPTKRIRAPRVRQARRA